MLLPVSHNGLNYMDLLTVTIHFVHILFWDPYDSTLFDDLGILSYHMLHELQVLHRDLGPVSGVGLDPKDALTNGWTPSMYSHFTIFCSSKSTNPS